MPNPFPSLPCPLSVHRFSRRVFIVAALCLLCGTIAVGSVFAQTKTQSQPGVQPKNPKAAQTVVVRGKIDQSQSPANLKIDLSEVKTTLNQEVVLPRAPFPKNWQSMTQEQRNKWVDNFQNSESGKAFIARNKKMLEAAAVFNVRYGENGNFEIYDVPPGNYGLRGRIDKDIDGVKHAFEVFARITIDDQFDEVTLGALPIAVTPLLTDGQPAPPVSVPTHNEKTQLDLDSGKLKGKYVLLNFWSTNDVAAGAPDHQKRLQSAIQSLQAKFPIELLSICVDEDRNSGIEHVMKQEYKIGKHAFTGGWDHETVKRYGVRSTPSGWLIAPDRTIAMTQFEFGRLSRQKESLAKLISDRIEGSDRPKSAAK